MSAGGAPPIQQARALVRDGRSYFAQGDVERARACFAAAVEIAPHDQNARAGLARCERLLAETTGGSDDATAQAGAASGAADSFAALALPGPDTELMSAQNMVVDHDETVVDGLAAGGLEAEMERAREQPRPGPGNARATPRGRQTSGPYAAQQPHRFGAGPSQPPGGRDAGPGPEPDFGPQPGIGPEGQLGGGDEPAYPRFVAGLPGNYPQVSPGGHPPPMMGPDGSHQSGAMPHLSPPLPLPPHGLPHVAQVMPYPPPHGPGPGATGPYPQFAAPAASGYVMSAFPGARSPRFLIATAGAIAVGFTGLGLLVGFLAFGGAGEGDPISAPKGAAGGGAEKVAGAVGAAGKQAAGETQTAAVGAASRASGAVPGSLEARVRTVEHPVLAVAVAPVEGEVERVHVKAGGAVTTGQRLYTLREGKGARAVETTVDAPAAGRIERRAARGDSVQKGDVLAQLVDPGVWNLVADMTSEEVDAQWMCEVSTVDGLRRAPCRVEGVQRLGGQQSRATASVVAEEAGWLQGGGQELLMALSPTAGSPALSHAAPSAPTGAAAAATAPAVPSAPARLDRDREGEPGSSSAGPGASSPPPVAHSMSPSPDAARSDEAGGEPDAGASR